MPRYSPKSKQEEIEAASLEDDVPFDVEEATPVVEAEPLLKAEDLPNLTEIPPPTEAVVDDQDQPKPLGSVSGVVVESDVEEVVKKRGRPKRAIGMGSSPTVALEGESQPDVSLAIKELTATLAEFIQQSTIRLEQHITAVSEDLKSYVARALSQTEAPVVVEQPTVKVEEEEVKSEPVISKILPDAVVERMPRYLQKVMLANKPIMVNNFANQVSTHLESQGFSIPSKDIDAYLRSINMVNDAGVIVISK